MSRDKMTPWADHMRDREDIQEVLAHHYGDPVAAPAQVTDAEFDLMWTTFNNRVGRMNNSHAMRKGALRATCDALLALRAAQPDAGGVVVPRDMLEQVYGMAREGCDAPNVAYRWCERIDELFHLGGPSDEYVEFAQTLPDVLTGQQKGGAR